MKEIFIERDNNLRVAIKDNNELTNMFFEESKKIRKGEIYKGIINNIIPSIKAAFVDIGIKQDCFMYLDEKFNNKHLQKGEEVLVEVINEGGGKKSPKVTTAITMPGRYVILETLNKKIKFSKNIKDEEFKKYIIDNIKIKEGIGILIRKKAENVNIDMVLEEIEILHNEYENLLDKKEYEKKLGCLYSPQGLIGEVLRDYMDLTVKTIYVNNISDYQVLTEAVKKYKDFLGNIILYENYQSIFLKYSLEEEIKKTMNKKIELPCRGNIVIDKTEAMYVIDVNSAKNIKGKSKESTAYITNLEASKEIAKQIILRNLSGIILIDFINIEDDSKKEKILNSLEEGFLNDKNKPKVYPFTELNLVQMTRKKSTPLSYYIEEDCEACSGSGKRLRLSYLELLIKNRIKSNNKADKFFIEINSIYKNQVEIDKDKFIEKIGIEKQNLFIRFSEFVGDFTVKFTLSEKEIEFYLKY